MIVNQLVLIIFIIELQPFAENYISLKAKMWELVLLDPCSAKNKEEDHNHQKLSDLEEK